MRYRSRSLCHHRRLDIRVDAGGKLRILTHIVGSAVDAVCHGVAVGSVEGEGNILIDKFRRTLATMAIDKGMPIEQVQELLGHQSVDTTLQYAMVNQANVKSSHRKFIG